MKVGDLIQFVSTGCQGLIVRVSPPSPSIEFLHVLCGPDADGEHAGETTAFPRMHLQRVAEVISASR
jgi:hypothetical protein